MAEEGQRMAVTSSSVNGAFARIPPVTPEMMPSTTGMWPMLRSFSAIYRAIKG